MKQINIKKTILLDKQIYFDLRNNLDNRKNSYNSKKIKIDDHNKWFKKNYKNKYYFTCYKGKSKIGYIRGDILGDTIIVSVALMNENQNKNIGSYCLNLFEKKININCILIAKVKKINRISSHFFEKNGYSKLNTLTGIVTYYKIRNNLSIRYLNVISNIENVRKNNNINWMNILRIAFKKSPEETSKVFKEIYTSDKKINKLTKKLF